MELGIETGKRVRMDSTSVESNIHYPTDSELLWDCVRVINRIVEKVIEEYPDMELEYHDHTKRAKKRRYRIVNTSSIEKASGSVQGFAEGIKGDREICESCIGQLDGKAREGFIEAVVYKEELAGYLESLWAIISQTERRY